MTNNIIDFNSIWKKKCKNIIHKSIYSAVKRIIVIGDIHGDYNMMIQLLKIGDLIDDNNKWIGKDTFVVQVGDQIDRCRPMNEPCHNKYSTVNDEANDIQILLFLTNLHYQATQSGGAVFSLLGNHELMNVDGQYKYVSYEGLKNIETRRKLFSKGQPLANFLACTRHMILIIGSNLFTHAGLISEISENYGIESINQIMTLYLLNEIDTYNNPSIYDKIMKKHHNISSNVLSDLFYNSSSPLWTRYYGNLPFNTNIKEDNLCNKNLNILKEIYKVDKIYVGHTPMLEKGITSVCNNKVWLTDFGASQAFDNLRNNNIKEAQVLEILNDGELIRILKSSSPISLSSTECTIL